MHRHTGTCVTLTKLFINKLACPDRHWGLFHPQLSAQVFCPSLDLDRASSLVLHGCASFLSATWRLVCRVLAVEAAAHQAPGAEGKAEGAGELRQTEGLVEEDLEVGVALAAVEE